MRKLLVTLVILCLVFAAGCSQTPVVLPSDSNEGTTPSDEPGISNKPEVNDEPEVILPREPPEDVTWISPGKVMVGNFYPGARAEWTLLVHNGNDIPASFIVTYRHPDHVGEDYVKPPEEVQDWVIIVDSTPVIAPRTTGEILVVLAMPKDAAVFAPKWEFWVSVKDTTQTGMVQTELCTRWLVTMR